MTPSNKKQVVILLGQPGSGKGTQGQLLSEKLNLYYFDTSKVLEESFKKAKKGEQVLVDGKKYSFEKEKELFLTGKLCSPPLVTYLVSEKIKTLFDEDKSVILAGSPRTLYEGERVVPLLKRLYGLKNIKVIMLEISAKETIWRNSHRKLCELMRHTIMYSKETEKLTKCPLDGSKLQARKGLDNIETIKVRLKEYQERTFPLLKFYQDSGLKVVKINGSPAPSVIFENILKVLK